MSLLSVRFAEGPCQLCRAVAPVRLRVKRQQQRERKRRGPFSIAAIVFHLVPHPPPCTALCFVLLCTRSPHPVLVFPLLKPQERERRKRKKHKKHKKHKTEEKSPPSGNHTAKQVPPALLAKLEKLAAQSESGSDSVIRVPCTPPIRTPLPHYRLIVLNNSHKPLTFLCRA